jgi:hypothetical protein
VPIYLLSQMRGYKLGEKRFGILQCAIQKMGLYSRAWGQSTNIQIIVGFGRATRPCAAVICVLGSLTRKTERFAPPLPIAASLLLSLIMF